MRTLHRNPDGSLANPYDDPGWNIEPVVWEENLGEFFECVALHAKEYEAIRQANYPIFYPYPGTDYDISQYGPAEFYAYQYQGSQLNHIKDEYGRDAMYATFDEALAAIDQAIKEDA
jgi:hypothetical protein